ncbi:MAG: hypothetical protein BWY45_03446 [Euryarchaeota archaeon ADurb.Bin294]|nr:MAG: hypothetical protein BWY45_03446 [Euryarchaeota archaeon ADurb.Bin294]
MKYIAFVFASLIFCLMICSFPVHAVISSSVYANGGSIIVNTDESWETSNNLMRFGTVNDSYEYGGKSQTIVSLGRTGIIKEDSTKIETLGMLNAFDSAGMFSTQTNIPESMCDQSNFIAGYGNQSSSRYPETQTVEGLWGLMGSGPGTTYESQVEVNDKVVGVSVKGTTPQGYLYEDVKGSLKSGLDVNSSTLQYSYSRHDRAVLNSDANKSLDGGFDWLWDTETEEIVNETVIEASEEANVSEDNDD